MKSGYVIALFCLLLSAYIIKSIYLLNASYTNSNEGIILNEKALIGKQIFRDKNCIACHQLYGLGGYMGPDLTNVLSAPGKGRNYARALISTGTARMPKMDIPDHEIEFLLDFLESIDKTGQSPLTNYKVSPYGNIEIGNSRKGN